LVGAAITAFVTLLIFIIDRTSRNIAAFRELRRVLIAEYMTAAGDFAVAATAPSGDWASETASLVAARSRLTLSLGLRHRTIDTWLTGMERLMMAAANRPRRTPGELKGIVGYIDERIGDVFNTLINLQQGRLFVADFTLPAGTMFLVLNDPDFLKEHMSDVEWAYRPQNGGRWHALLLRVAWTRNRIKGWFTAWRRSSDYIDAPRDPAPPKTTSA